MSIGELKEIVNHPELEKSLADYTGILDFLEGSLSTISGYVNKYQAEDAQNKEALDHFNLRLRQLYHKPIMEPSHQIHMAHLNQAIKWGGIEESAIKDFLEDVTGEQVTAQDFLSEMLWYRIGLGKVGVLVDGPKSDGQTKSKDEARSAGERSYQILYRADQIKYWEFALSGDLKGKLVKVVLVDKPRTTEQGETIPRLRRFFYPPGANQYSWQVLELRTGDGSVKAKSAGAGRQKWEVIEEGSGTLSEIPFVMWGRGLKDSILRNVWQLEKANLNNGSVKTNIMYRQGFQRTIVAGAKDHELKMIGESIINKVADHDAKVQTIEPGNPEAHFKEEALIESRAQRIALLQHNQLVDDTRQVQSAESKAKDLTAREKYYNKILDEAQRILKKIWGFHFEFEGIQGAEKLQISISRDFGLKASDEEIKERTNISFLARQVGATEVVKEVLKTEISKSNWTVTKDNETEEELKQRLYDIVDSAELPEVTASPFQANNRPSVGSNLRPNVQ